MRFLFLFAIILTASFSAKAETFVSKEQANTYYQNCVANAAATEQRFSKNAQHLFCACTAARLTQYFSIEDMQTMSDPNNPGARTAVNKMILNIYAPCMEEPTRERYLANCEQTAGFNKQVCDCAANKIAHHMKDHGAEIFGNIIAQNPTIQDPWDALENDPAFNQFKEDTAKSCM